MWSSIATFILRYRIPVLIFVAVATIFMGFEGRNVKMSYKFNGVLPNDDSTAIAYQKFLKEFSEDGNVVVLGVQGQQLYDYKNFRAWYELGRDLQKISGVDSVFSEANLYKLAKDTAEHRFVLKPFLTHAPTSQSEVDSVLHEIKQYPFYRGLLYNDTTKASLMMVFVNAAKFNSEARGDVVAEIHKRTEEFSSQSGMTVHYSGLPYIRTVVASRVKKEISMFVGLAALVTAILLFIFFRSFKVVVISMIVVAVGVAWALGTIALFDYRLTMLMALIPPLVIVIGIPNCVFLINKYHQEYRYHGNQMKALTRVIQKIGVATFMTNFTTATGFATFIFTQSAILKQFGVIASLNIINVFVLSILLIPTILSFLPGPPEKHTSHLDRKSIKAVVEGLVKIVSHYRRAVYIVAITAVVVGIYGVSLIKTSGKIVDDLPKGDTVLDDLNFFQANFNGVMPLEVVISSKKKGGITSFATLKRIEKLQNVIEQYPEISKSLSIVDAEKFAKQAFYNGSPSKYTLIQGYEKAFILPYLNSKSKSGHNLSTLFIDSTRTTTRVSAQIADIGTDHMAVLMKKLTPEVDKIFPKDKYNVDFTGTSVVFLQGTNYLVNNLIISLAIAIVVIALTMAMLFTSARMVVISLFPNLIPLICTGAIMGFVGIPLKPSTILVFSIAFGISVDDTIHFLAKYRQELKLMRYDLRTCVITAVRETGISMIYTSVILFFGFGIFVLSNFGGTVALGFLVSITLLIAMFTNLLLLPSLLMSFSRSLTSKAFSQEPLVQIVDEEEDIELDALTIRKNGEEVTSEAEKNSDL